MTNEQALSQEPCEDDRNNLCSSCTNIGCEFQSGIVRTKCAFYMPPHIETDNCGNYVVMQPVRPQEPCDDTISRQAVIDCFKKWQPYMATRLCDFEKELFNLPSVTQKSGKWIEKDVCNDEDNGVDAWQSARCSKCGKYHTTPYMYYFDDFEFCPNCGAKMESEV